MNRKKKKKNKKKKKIVSNTELKDEEKATHSELD
jgi:hypothetical protein